MKCVIVLLVCVVAVSSQVPFRCKSPDTWEARVYEVQLQSGTTRLGRLYYDAPGERIAFEEEIIQGDDVTAAYTDYFFHKTHTMLKYNRMTKMCYRYPLNETFYPIEVPPTAQYLDTFVIGTNAVEKYGLTVNVWGDNSGSNGRVVMEYVADDGDGDENCLPVSFTEFGGGSGSRGYRHQSFYNIVIGVNPDHFIPPPGCPVVH